MSKNIRHLSHAKGLQNSLFDAVTAARTGDELNQHARQFGLTPSILNGTASFYDFLDVENDQADTWVCHGTACLVNGSSANTAAQYPAAKKAMCCGHCYGGAGLLHKNTAGELESGQQSATGILQPEMPVYNLSESAVLTAEINDIESLYQVALDNKAQILPELKTALLRGRGGAGFEFSFKCQAVAQAADKEKYIVCNADEGDPGAFSDRYLLEQHPHKVMAGMFAAGLAVGAQTGILYIRYEYPEAIRLVDQAIIEFNHLINDISQHFTFYIVVGAGAYVCGEETALLQSIEGQRPEVRVRPPYPATHGLWDKPTLLSNVETFANVPWILQQSGAAYAAIGTEHSKGTKLISLDSQFVRPGLYEVDFGYPFSELVFKQAGGFNADIKGLQVGGPLGCILPLTKVDDLTLCFEQFQDAGLALGHAGVIAIPQQFPMIDFMRHIFSYMADESCGKCVPCRMGTAKGTQLLAAATPEQPLDRLLFDDLLELLQQGSLCALGGGIPLPMRNALSYFSDELAPYFKSSAVE